MNTPHLILQRTLPLFHSGDCALLGIDSIGRVAVEEFYADWYAQHLFDRDGTLITSRDEDNGYNPNPEPLPNLHEFRPPSPVGHAAKLNYTAGRLRGLREADRIAETVQPLTVPEKIGLAAIPGSILGIAENYIMAEAVLNSALSLICRRVRIAHAVSPARDSEGLPYDYDTYTLYLTQWFDPAADDAPLSSGIVVLGKRPMDLLLDGRLLYVADGGDPGSRRMSVIHIFQVA